MPKTKTGKKGSRQRSRHRGVQGRANADVGAHIQSLGLQSVAQYQRWCRDHGFTTALIKDWRDRRSEREVLKREADLAASQQDVLLHVNNLGLATIEAYRSWCSEHDLSDSLHKGPRQRRKELELHKEEAGQAALRRDRRLTRRRRDTIAALFAYDPVAYDPATHNQIPGDPLGGDLQAGPQYLSTIAECARQLHETPAAWAAFRDLLLVVDRAKADFFDDRGPAVSRFPPSAGNTWIGGLAALATSHERWLRLAAHWRPAGHGPRRQFGSLLRHLLAHYELPAFCDSVFLADPTVAEHVKRKQQDWVEHIGKGGNIRTAPGLPVTLTKRMAHETLLAPARYTMGEALRYGQIIGQGGTPSLVEAVIATHLGTSFNNEDFWSTYLHWLTRHPMLDSEWVGPMAAYLQERKFVAQDGAAPPEPNLSMQSRSLEKLLRQVEEWQTRSSRDQRVVTTEWTSCGIGEYTEVETDEETGQNLTWSVRELTTTKQLVIEGKVMSHCVRSYTRSCRTGRKAVFSVQRQVDNGRTDRMLTVAIHPEGRRVIQARGKHNAAPVGKIAHLSTKRLGDRYPLHLLQARAVMRRWEEQQGLIPAKL